MILQQLERDADRLVPDMPPSMYDRKAVKWVVHLDGQGRAEWPPERLSGGDGRTDRGKTLLVPFKTRAYGIRPLLLADKVTYTWGIPVDHPRAKDERAAYLDLVDDCARETEDGDVAKVAAFLRSWSPEAEPLPDGMDAGDLTPLPSTANISSTGRAFEPSGRGWQAVTRRRALRGSASSADGRPG